MTAYDRAVAASRHTLRALSTLGEQLNDAQWAAATECPEWSVGDIFAHLIGVEQWMIDGAPELAGPLQPFLDDPVLARRGLSRATVLAELREVFDRREQQLTVELPAPDTAAWAPWARRSVPYQLQLASRSFDLWTHEQDIRRAVGQPGNLGSAGAVVTRDMILLALPRTVGKTAGAPLGSTVRLTTLGEVPMDIAIHVDSDGRAALVPTDIHRATAHATLGWEAFARLSAGRGARTRYQVWLSGDRDLAEEVLTNLNIAP